MDGFDMFRIALKTVKNSMLVMHLYGVSHAFAYSKVACLAYNGWA